jgi:hypothetical protein
LTVPLQLPESFDWVMLAGQVIRGGGFVATTVAVETLLAGLLSGVEALNTIAVFPMTVLPATEQLTRAVIVMTAVEPEGSDAKVIVRLLPDPPQTPPPVELQERKERLAESTSVTVTDVAAAGPAFVTRIVFVTSAPVSTGLGAMVTTTDKSAGVPPTSPPT